MNSINSEKCHKSRPQSSDFINIRASSTSTNLETLNKCCSEQKFTPFCENRSSDSNICRQCQKDSGFITPNSSKENKNQTSASEQSEQQKFKFDTLPTSDNNYFQSYLANQQNLLNSLSLAGFVPATSASLPPNIIQSYPLYYIPVFLSNSVIPHKPIMHSKSTQTVFESNSKFDETYLKELETQVTQKLNSERNRLPSSKMLPQDSNQSKKYQQNNIREGLASNNENRSFFKQNYSQASENPSHCQCKCDCSQNAAIPISYKKLEDNEDEYQLTSNSFNQHSYKNEPSVSNQFSSENLLKYSEQNDERVIQNETYINSHNLDEDYDSDRSNDSEIDNRSYVLQTADLNESSYLNTSENIPNPVSNNSNSHPSLTNHPSGYNNQQAAMLMFSLLSNQKKPKPNNSRFPTSLLNQINNTQLQSKSDTEAHGNSSTFGPPKTPRKYGFIEGHNKNNFATPLNAIHKIPVALQHSESKRSLGRERQYSKIPYSKE